MAVQLHGSEWKQPCSQSSLNDIQDRSVQGTEALDMQESGQNVYVASLMLSKNFPLITN
jgi:hypothetical protein